MEQGYAYVHADVRGTGLSEGDFEFLGRNEQHDLYDIIEWIGSRSWSNGKIGGIGQSYYAMSQWFMGVEGPPHLACIAPYDGLNDPYRFMGYPGGIEGTFLSYWFNSSVRVSNLYPANGDNPRHVEPDLFLDIQRHPLYDEFWKERAAFEQLDKITVPVFSIGVWAKQSLHLAGNIAGYQRVRGPRKLAITGVPAPHSATMAFADPNFHLRYLLPFYDRHLKDVKTSFDDRPNVQYEVWNTGVERSFDTWPPPGIRPARFYLGSGVSGTVKSLNDGVLASSTAGEAGATTSYSYPQPSWVFGVVALAPDGPDPVRGVLTFTTEPLEADLEVAGSGKLTIYASTTRNDMDFLVKVSEQMAQSPEEHAKGTQPQSTIVSKGWLRASHMERDPERSTDDIPDYTHGQVTPLVPETIYKIDIPLQPIAYRFSRGHRIRLEVSNGDSPVTDAIFFHFYRPDKIGTDTLYHDADHPSELWLPELKTD